MAREKSSTGRVRIIGGRWRGRRISFHGLDGLRPTPDRVRETVFNWLAPYLDGARVLDLFAGSGVLGLEALSRGASSVVAVDVSDRVVRRLRQAASELGAADFDAVASDAREFLASYGAAPFDLVFVDPPHATADYGALCRSLEASRSMAPTALVYLELPRRQAPAFRVPDAWESHRKSETGNLMYGIWRRNRGDQPRRGAD